MADAHESAGDVISLSAHRATPATQDVSPEVMAAACHRDHAAFAQVVATYDERLRALAYDLLGSRQAMDDVLQETYLLAYRGLPAFRGDSSLGTWLHRIAYTACLQRLRRAPDAEPLPQEVLEALETTERTDDQVALRDQLRGALAELSPERRAAVLLVLRDGFSYADAAAVLGVPVGTVASRVAAARDRLVEHLSRQDEGGDAR
jgi:RNA polymerase sigma-70 factor, ECF subfamily